MQSVFQNLNSSLFPNTVAKAIFIFTSLATFFASLNYSGFCVRRFEYVNSEEKIKAVFQDWNQRSKFSIRVNGELKMLEREKKYDSFEQFRAQHPDCCEINPNKPIELPPPSFIDRVTGYYSGSVILLQFQERFLDKDGDVIIIDLEVANALQNCGEIKW